MATSAPPAARLIAAPAPRPAVERLVGAERQRELATRGHGVDDADAARAGEPRHLHEQQADRAEADHRHVVAELDPRVVRRRPARPRRR